MKVSPDAAADELDGVVKCAAPPLPALPSAAAAVESSPPSRAGDVADDGLDGAQHEEPLFSWAQFLQQVPFQFLFPFSVPFAALLFSRGWALNLMGAGSPWERGDTAKLIRATVFVCNGFTPFLTIIAYALSPPETNVWADATLRSDAIHVIIGYCSLRLAVSIKYAFLTPSVYARRLAEWVPNKELNAEQLVTGWRRCDEAAIARGVDLAAAQRHECAEDEAFEATPEGFARIVRCLKSPRARALLEAAAQGGGGLAGAGKSVGGGGGSGGGGGGDGGVGGVGGVGGAAADNDGGESSGASVVAASDASSAPAGSDASLGAPAPPRTRLPVVAVCNVLLVEAATREEGFVNSMDYVLFAVAAIGTFTTSVARVLAGAPALGGGTTQAVVIVSHWIVNLTLLSVTFSFLIVGAVDHRRRARSHSLLGGLFELRARGAPPALSFDCVSQARAFLAARGVLIGFGASFHYRLVVVTSASAFVFLAVAAYCIYMLNTSDDTGYVISSFILLHVLVAPAAACVGLGLFEAAAANDAMRRHVTVVVDARLRLRMAPAGSAAAAAAVGMAPLLEDMERHISEDFKANPISILGVAATPTLVKAFASAWLTLETAAVSLYTLWLRRRAGAASA